MSTLIPLEQWNMLTPEQQESFMLNGFAPEEGAAHPEKLDFSTFTPEAVEAMYLSLQALMGKYEEDFCETLGDSPYNHSLTLTHKQILVDLHFLDEVWLEEEWK